jgi:hypothetical protein
MIVPILIDGQMVQNLHIVTQTWIASVVVSQIESKTHI